MPKPTTPDDDNATSIEPFDAGDAGAWLSVSAAALALGVSARAIQKRAERGTLTARRVAHGRAHRWEIDAREIGGDAFANGSQDVRKMGAKRSQDVRDIAAPEREPVRERFAKGSQDGRDDDDGLTARLLTQLETENKFLRATVEQLQRSNAETHAEHRAALKLLGAASVPQLTAGDATEPPGARESGAAVNQGAANVESQQRGTVARETGAFDYGAICDFIEGKVSQ
jgi:hypothetical protein